MDGLQIVQIGTSSRGDVHGATVDLIANGIKLSASEDASPLFPGKLPVAVRHVPADIQVENVYIVCGYTDMRGSVAGLTTMFLQQFHMQPDVCSLFLFCGKRADRMKALIREGDG